MHVIYPSWLNIILLLNSRWWSGFKLRILFGYIRSITEIDSASNHSSGSNIDIDFGNKSGSDEVDSSYISFLATYDMVVEIDIASSDYGCSNPIWSTLKP